MPNRNRSPRFACPDCNRLIRAKAVKHDNGDGTETLTWRLVPHGVGITKAKSMSVNKAYPCKGGDKEVNGE